MKSEIDDPWGGTGVQVNQDKEHNGCFEDSFVEEKLGYTKLLDSEEYLQRLYSKLKALKDCTSKKDLVNSLSDAKEDYIAHLLTSKYSLESEENEEIASNPLIRHIAPHLQALSATELVHLLKADFLQAVNKTEEEETAEQLTGQGTTDNQRK